MKEMGCVEFNKANVTAYLSGSGSATCSCLLAMSLPHWLSVNIVRLSVMKDFHFKILLKNCGLQDDLDPKPMMPSIIYALLDQAEVENSNTADFKETLVSGLFFSALSHLISVWCKWPWPTHWANWQPCCCISRIPHLKWWIQPSLRTAASGWNFSCVHLKGISFWRTVIVADSEVCPC